MQFSRAAVFVMAGAAFLSACGDAATTGGTTTVLNLDSTSFATLAPTLSTLPPTSSPAPSEGEVTTEVTEYTVVANDVPINVARRYGITLDALNNANLDTADYSDFYVGIVIKIPAGAIVPGTASVPTTTVGAATPTPAATTLPPSSGCTVGSHTIVEGDLPGTVAAQYDVTLEALEAANANTRGYKSFILGVKIIIPCP